ncbi:MAG: hypothetical protein Roseis2KO_59870 [Roseivirga sp.]
MRILPWKKVKDQNWQIWQMKCYKSLIWLCVLVVLLAARPGLAQNAAHTRFDALVNEQMTEFMGRDYWQKPAILLELMDIQPAETVADLGCGTGYFSLKLIKQVGPDGKVIALDNDATKLNRLRLLKRYGSLEELEIVQNQPDDLKVAASSLDKIIIFNAYHEFSDVETLLAQCRAALKPGGKVYIIDKVSDKMDNDKSSRKKLVKNHFITRKLVEEELKAASFGITQSMDKYTENEKAEETRKTNWFVVVATKE